MASHVLRTIKIYNGDEVRMMELHTGDIFEIFEPDGEKVGECWIACAEPEEVVINEEGGGGTVSQIFSIAFFGEYP